ncbi:MAG: hypothetical protein EOO99_11430 [Pedobacter sp.]|nr:MAG: hypothetical protein EOO99_11430 [Pedobacter sp.]
MIGIHDRKGSFSDRWIQYCKLQNIPFKIVNCYENDIIQQLEGCQALMWHHHHGNIKDIIFAKQLLYSIQQSGKFVFPTFNDSWHFDDKLGQKYLLESIQAPMVPTYVFYDRKQSLEWAQVVNYPKVFKLRGGAGSSNVKLIKSIKECEKIISKAFSTGIPQFDKWNNLREQFLRFKNGKGNYLNIFKGLYRLFIPTKLEKASTRQINYVYFQEFIPGNDGDIRVIIIGDKAFIIERKNRENDFRASGSGIISYPDNNSANKACIELAFSTTEKLKGECIAFDFILRSDGSPLIVELSYAFTTAGYDKCKGYWNRNLEWFETPFNPQEWMVELVKDKI